MIKLENARLRAPRKISMGSGLHSQKRIRAPVSKMIGLRAPQQKFPGSRAPGTPPLGPCLLESTAKSSPLCKECFRKVESLIKRTKDFEGGKREITEVRNLCSRNNCGLGNFQRTI